MLGRRTIGVQLQAELFLWWLVDNFIIVNVDECDAVTTVAEYVAAMAESVKEALYVAEIGISVLCYNKGLRYKGIRIRRYTAHSICNTQHVQSIICVSYTRFRSVWMKYVSFSVCLI